MKNLEFTKSTFHYFFSNVLCFAVVATGQAETESTTQHKGQSLITSSAAKVVDLAEEYAEGDQKVQAATHLGVTTFGALVEDWAKMSISKLEKASADEVRAQIKLIDAALSQAKQLDDLNVALMANKNMGQNLRSYQAALQNDSISKLMKSLKEFKLATINTETFEREMYRLKDFAIEARVSVNANGTAPYATLSKVLRQQKTLFGGSYFSNAAQATEHVGKVWEKRSPNQSRAKESLRKINVMGHFKNSAKVTSILGAMGFGVNFVKIWSASTKEDPKSTSY